jgi:hypothetical protein
MHWPLLSSCAPTKGEREREQAKHYQTAPLHRFQLAATHPATATEHTMAPQAMVAEQPRAIDGNLHGGGSSAHARAMAACGRTQPKKRVEKKRC